MFTTHKEYFNNTLYLKFGKQKKITRKSMIKPKIEHVEQLIRDINIDNLKYDEIKNLKTQITDLTAKIAKLTHGY